MPIADGINRYASATLTGGPTKLFHWDAELGRTMAGSKVATWTDQIGGVVFSQTNDANRGLYDSTQLSIAFTEVDGVNYHTLTVPTNIPKPYSMVVCFKRGADNTINPTATVRIVSRAVSAHGLHKYSFNPTPMFNCGNAGGQDVGVTIDGNYHVVVRTFDSSDNSTVYRDATQVDYDAGLSDYSGPTGSTLAIGGDGLGAGAGNFWLRHLIIYSGVLSAAQIAQLQVDLMSDLPNAPSITTSSLPNGTEGSPYSQQLVATGDGTIVWDVTAGSLPGGMTLSSTGLLSSTSLTQNGVFAFTIRVQSEYGSYSHGFILLVAEAPPVGIPVFIGADIADQAWVIGEAVSLDISSRFTGESNYALVEPWPLGLTISSGGVISGNASTTEFTHPRCCVKAINPNGEAISNFFEVTVTNPIPPTNNLLMNSRMMFSDPVQDPYGPWHWNLSGITSRGTIARTLDGDGYALEFTTNVGVNCWLASQGYYGFEAGVKYTIMADVTADVGNNTAQIPFVFDPGTGYTQHSSGALHSVAAGETKRAFVCFSFTANASRTIQIYTRSATGGANKMTISHIQLVRGEYLTLGSLPAYEPTGPASNGTHVTIRDLGTIGRQVRATEFMFDGLWWSTPDYVYDVNAALANTNNLYYSPRPEAPRLEAGAFKVWCPWNVVETSPGVFNWAATDQYGRPANKLAQVCSVFNLPFIMVLPMGPPQFYPSWRVNPTTGYGALVKDFTKLNALMDSVLATFVPLGLMGLEIDGEPSGGFWGERDTTPVTTDDWRAAATVFSRVAKIFRDKIDAYNTANNTTLRLFGPGDTSNFNDAQRFSSPGYLQYGPGFLDGSDGAGGIGIDHIDGISFHGYYQYVDTGLRIIKTIDQVQKWAKNLGRPDIALWCSEGLGKENPLTAFSTSPLAIQCRFMLGANAAMMTYDSQGFCHYAWDHNGAGFYGAIQYPPPQGDYTNDWVDNYAVLEAKWNALKALVTTGGRRVYACRVRESDTVIEILVGTTRAGATWYAMDETFTG